MSYEPEVSWTTRMRPTTPLRDTAIINTETDCDSTVQEKIRPPRIPPDPYETLALLLQRYERLILKVLFIPAKIQDARTAFMLILSVKRSSQIAQERLLLLDPMLTLPQNQRPARAGL